MELVKKNSNTNILLGFLFCLMMGDYILTYWGIHGIGVIQEANTLMVWLFDLPLWKGIFIRGIYVLLPIGLLKVIGKYRDPVTYRKVLLVPLGIQLIPLAAHIYWIYTYFLFK